MSLLYDLVQIRAGKEIVCLTGTFAKVMQRLKQLRTASRRSAKTEIDAYGMREAVIKKGNNAG